MDPGAQSPPSERTEATGAEAKGVDTGSESERSEARGAEVKGVDTDVAEEAVAEGVHAHGAVAEAEGVDANGAVAEAEDVGQAEPGVGLAEPDVPVAQVVGDEGVVGERGEDVGPEADADLNGEDVGAADPNGEDVGAEADADLNRNPHVVAPGDTEDSDFRPSEHGDDSDEDDSDRSDDEADSRSSEEEDSEGSDGEIVQCGRKRSKNKSAKRGQRKKVKVADPMSQLVIANNREPVTANDIDLSESRLRKSERLARFRETYWGFARTMRDNHVGGDAIVEHCV